MYSAKDHTFVICAYRENKYLEECIKSILYQSNKTNVIMTTSTPNSYIEKLAAKYNIDLIINRSGNKGVVTDWNFAYNSATTNLITICHQDDIYCTDYAKELLKTANKSKNMLIFFSDYYELREGKRIHQNSLLLIKRILLYPLRFRFMWSNKWIRRRILSFGSSICCPSVTFNRSIPIKEIFTDNYQSILDWEAWEKISRFNGEFLYCSKPLICHRIHNESLTTRVIENKIREKEELEMFQKFWPGFMANTIGLIYKLSSKSNSL